MSDRQPIQVVCAATGDSQYVRPRYLPMAREYRAGCPCGCGAAEYRGRP